MQTLYTCNIILNDKNILRKAISKNVKKLSCEYERKKTIFFWCVKSKVIYYPSKIHTVSNGKQKIVIQPHDHRWRHLICRHNTYIFNVPKCAIKWNAIRIAKIKVLCIFCILFRISAKKKDRLGYKFLSLRENHNLNHFKKRDRLSHGLLDRWTSHWAV